MKKRSAIFMSVLLLMCGVANAGIVPGVIDWEPGVTWSSLWYMETTQNNDLEDEVVSDNRALFTNDISWKEKQVYGKLDWEWRYDTFNGGLDDEGRGKVRFREAYTELRRENYRISVGQKIVTWGKLDDLVVLDRVVPQDFSHFILYDKQERKDPALMVQHEWFMGQGFELETIFMPVFKPSELDFFGSNWAVFDHLKEAVSSGSYTAAQKTSVAGIAIRDDDQVTDESLRNSQIALRLRGKKGEVDYDIYYLNLYHSLPVLKETNPLGNTTKRFLYDPTAANLNALVSSGASGDDLLLTEAHPRVQAVGADWETVCGQFGLRGEMALFYGMPYLADDFAYTEKNQVSVGFGIDHTTESQWYFDVQYLQDYILNYTGLYGVDETPSQFAGSVSKDFMRGILKANVDWSWEASYGDWMLNPELTYKWERPGLHLSVGVFFFQDGPSSSIFGRYDSNDVAYFKLGGKF